MSLEVQASKLLKEHISFSELTDFYTCPFKHKMKWIDKLVPMENNVYLSNGKAVHDVLEGTIKKEGINEEEIKNIFQLSFLSFLKEGLPPEYFKKNKSLILQMKEKGGSRIVQTIEAIREKFGNFEIINCEQMLYENFNEAKHLWNDEETPFKFKGFIDIILKTEDGKYHVIDYKTCMWGWDARKKGNKKVLYQLMLYKKFFGQAMEISLDQIDVHFVLIKLTPKKNNIEFISPTSGAKRIENSIEYLLGAVAGISKSNPLKNRLNCKWCDVDKLGLCKKNNFGKFGE